MIHGLEYYKRYSIWPEGAVSKVKELIPGKRYYMVRGNLTDPAVTALTLLRFSKNKSIIFTDQLKYGASLHRFNIPKHLGYGRFIFKNYWLAHAFRCRVLMEREKRKA